MTGGFGVTDETGVPNQRHETETLRYVFPDPSLTPTTSPVHGSPSCVLSSSGGERGGEKKNQ